MLYEKFDLIFFFLHTYKSPVKFSKVIYAQVKHYIKCAANLQYHRNQLN